MKDATPVIIRREDYRPPAYSIERVDLELDLDEDKTRVSATSTVVRNAGTPDDAPLVLDGQDIELISVSVDGVELTPAAYTLQTDSLTLLRVPARFVLNTVGHVSPKQNRALEGLYVSSGSFCTQCEAEGFRRITWFLDRPDVMARYRTTLRADRARYPMLLSNGNLIDSGELAPVDGVAKHFAVWEDPFPKPCYLFALVAGKLSRKEDSFVTRSGRKVTLHIYVDEEHLDQTDHCMDSLKRSMKWDEETFGREYDLDIYMIVAVRDFNMGAMENKGLNVFNTKYVLARPDTATDADFQNVEAVVAHEYFHNWSGNRVTCRDWFQLSLKEGFTVFRDQEFSSDVGSRALKRVQDVQRLLSVQFPEDAGPTAHPVRPDSYVEINNFYTATVYEKGAEVVRMMQTLLGRERFRAGTDLYFERHDGQAVTCDDFVRAMEDASGVDLKQFRRWYSQAGTPIIRATGRYDAGHKTYQLDLTQDLPKPQGQKETLPLHIPIRMGLLGADGKDLPLRLEDEPKAVGHTRLLELRETKQRFTFVDVPSAPAASLLRGFSAPVRLESDSSDAGLLLRMAHDSDSYGRWEASQTLAQRRVLSVLEAMQQGVSPAVDNAFSSAFCRALESEADPQLLAQALALPAETVISDRLDSVDPTQVHAARAFVEQALANAAKTILRARYDALTDSGTYARDATSMGRRSLRNLCLRYLMSIHDRSDGGLAREQLERATNLTDMIAALAALSNVEGPDRVEALQTFYARYEREALVIDKWFAIQAMSQRPSTLEDVRRLLGHPAFDLGNPNRARALIDSFAGGNALRFHEPSGAGYAFLADRVIEIDRFNPQVAARMTTPLTRFERFEPTRRSRMIEEVRRVLAVPTLSRDVYEQASKALQSAGPTK